MNDNKVGNSHSSFWDWIVSKAKDVEHTIEHDVENSIKDIKNEIADYIDQHAQEAADKVSQLIQKAGASIEKEVSKIVDMIGGDIDEAVKAAVAKVVDAFHLDPETAAKLESEIQAFVDGKVSGALDKIEKAIQKAVDGESKEVGSKITDFLHHLANEIRGKA